MTESTRKFKTEIQHLLDLMIHSLYSNKDIFLRELIANAADAIDKARFESLTNKNIASEEWEIRIETDKEKNTISISDNGIGMTREEIIANIGTIAKSGSKAFLAALEQKKEQDIPELIGQFGVGFYSSFMVAERVEVVSKKALSDEVAVKWSSTGKESYSVDDADRDTQGTTVTLFLKEESTSYLDQWQIKSVVKRYSDFIEYPVKMEITKKEDDKDVTEDETLNSQKAIWIKPPSEVSDEEHNTFFNHLSHAGGNPLTKIHFSAEGTTEFKALLYLPEKAPFDLFMPEDKKKGLHLYIKRVFISDECTKLLPEYLRFVKGVVDSSDLPLNVSREILQDNATIAKIEKNLVRKLLAEMKKLQEKEPEKYLKFYTEFGKILKEGLHTDFANKEKLTELVMFETMQNEAGKLVTLKEYVTAMPPEQKEIYYATGENRTALENSPHLELLKSKGFDVLFMTDPIDEWVVQSLTAYDEKKLSAIGKGEIALDDETKKATEEKNKKATEEHKTLIEYLKKTLDDRVKDVRFSQRLTESACCLVSDEYDMSPNMERIFKAMNQQAPVSKRILELNADHALIEAMQGLYDKDSKSDDLKDFAGMLFDQALLTEGSPIKDPLNFSRKIADLMVSKLGNQAS